MEKRIELEKRGRAAEEVSVSHSGEVGRVAWSCIVYKVAIT